MTYCRFKKFRTKTTTKLKKRRQPKNLGSLKILTVQKQHQLGRNVEATK